MSFNFQINEKVGLYLLVVYICHWNISTQEINLIFIWNWNYRKQIFNLHVLKLSWFSWNETTSKSVCYFTSNCDDKHVCSLLRYTGPQYHGAMSVYSWRLCRNNLRTCLQTTTYINSPLLYWRTLNVVTNFKSFKLCQYHYIRAYHTNKVVHER